MATKKNGHRSHVSGFRWFIKVKKFRARMEQEAERLKRKYEGK